jgi:hypothetical protein
MNYLRSLILAALLCALAGVGCFGEDDKGLPLMTVYFVQPYPLSGTACGDVQIDFTPIGVEPNDSSITPCSDMPLTGEAGDVYGYVDFFPPGDWTVTVTLRGGDCIGDEDFVKREDEAVTVWVELSCK